MPLFCPIPELDAPAALTAHPAFQPHRFQITPSDRCSTQASISVQAALFHRLLQASLDNDNVSLSFRFHFTRQEAFRRKETMLIQKQRPAHAGRCCFIGFWRNYSSISMTTPEPTVRPPSRIAKRRPFSIAIGVISSTFMSMLSPGMHISTPSGREMMPVTSVVLK